MSQSSVSGQIENCLQRWAQGEQVARDELLGLASDWLRRLVAVMLADYPRVRRWGPTDDVLQIALLLLWQALRDLKPSTPREFCGLATLQIRRELIDLARHYVGPHGPSAHHVTHDSPLTDAPCGFAPAGDTSYNPARLATSTDFHNQIALLPPDLRAAFETRWYLNLPYAEAAELLGISVSSVIRHYQAACRTLGEVFKGELPFA